MTFIYSSQKENETINLYKYEGENLKPANQQISSKGKTKTLGSWRQICKKIYN